MIAFAGSLSWVQALDPYALQCTPGVMLLCFSHERSPDCIEAAEWEETSIRFHNGGVDVRNWSHQEYCEVRRLEWASSNLIPEPSPHQANLAMPRQTNLADSSNCDPDPIGPTLEPRDALFRRGGEASNRRSQSETFDNR